MVAVPILVIVLLYGSAVPGALSDTAKAVLVWLNGRDIAISEAHYKEPKTRSVRR